MLYLYFVFPLWHHVSIREDVYVMRISNKKLDATMQHLLEQRNMSDERLTEFANTGNNRVYMECLRAMHAIDFKVAFGLDVRCYDLRILDDGILYFYHKQERSYGFWKGLFWGFVSACASGVVVTVIVKLII